MSNGRSRPDSLSGTPALLVETAERLIAAHGLDKVSLRQIVAATGHRNVSAVHYHFDSKQALLRAVVERRLPQINQRRMELMTEMESAGRAGDADALVEAIAVPVLEADATAGSGGYYARFLAHVVADDELAHTLFDELEECMGSSVELVRAWNEKAFAHLPEYLRVGRRSMCIRLILASIVERQREEESGTPAMTREDFVQELVDACSGLIRAPSSLI